MQKTTTVILLLSIVAIAGTFLVSYGMLPTTFVIAKQASILQPSESPLYLGHVTYTVRGPDGHIKAYVQSDNTRTVQGINCAEQVLFGTQGQVINTNGSNVCNGMTSRGSAGFNGFNVVGLINGSGTVTLNGSDTATLSKIGGTRASSADGLILTATANEGGPAVGTAAGTSTYNQITVTSPSFAFTNLKSTGTTIRGSMLMNNTSATSGSDNVFAENVLSPTVSVGSADTLTVTWTITLT